LIDVVLDFETYFDTKVSLTKLTTMEYIKHPMFKVWGVGIKYDDAETMWFSEDEVEDELASIDWGDVRLICHNTPFDAYVLTQYYGYMPAYFADTAAMARGRYPGQSARLADVAVRLFPNDETMRKGGELAEAKGTYDLSPEQDEMLGRYCVQDVDLTYAIWRRLLLDYPKSELDLINLTTQMFVDPIIEIDKDTLTKYHESQVKNRETLIENAGIDAKVLSSNDKFADYLRTIDIEPPVKRSTNTGNLIPAFGKNDAGWKQMCAMYPEHDNLWKAREAVKSRISETRAQRFLDAALDDNRIPVPLRYYAAHTGRFGGTEKLNMQNLPRGGELRRCLVAPKGHLVYVADLSNIEARMLAYVARQDDLIEQFARGDDIYSNFASVIYEKPINKRDNPTERFVGKTAILGLGYGMGARKFQATLKSGAMGPPQEFTLEAAMDIVGKYRTTYNNIALLWNRLQDMLQMTLHHENWGMNYGPFFTVERNGFRLPNGMSLSYEALSPEATGGFSYMSRGKKEYTYGGRITENLIQALSRIVITDSMLRLQKKINGRVALTVHDEVIIIAANTNPDATMNTIIDDLCIAPEWAPDLPLAAEGGYDTVYSK
jgi:DNA polymerase bacteriophage-type